MIKTENIIKAQARNYLRQGNWSTLVGCLAVLFICFFLVYYVFGTLIFGFNLVNIHTGEIKKSGQLLGGIFFMIALLLLILITPIINGFFKLCYSVAKNQDCSSIDLFYYFKNPILYFKVILLNILRFFIILLSTIVFSIPASVMFFLSDNLSGSSSALFQSISVILTIISAVLQIIGLFAVFCLYTKTVFCNYILADDDSKNAGWYIKESFKLSKGHNIDIIKLILSFILWILACFFVFPVFYVIPYMGVSLGNSAKWLIQLKKEASDLKC